MAVQRRNSEMVDLLAADFQPRYEPQFAWKSAVSQHQVLPGLRGFWPTSSVDTNGDLIDMSGQGNHLTLNGNPWRRGYNLAPTCDLDGVGDYFSHVGGIGSWCDILGSETYILQAWRGLTIGGWFLFDNAAGVEEYMISKWDTGGNERSYRLVRRVAGGIRFSVSDDGTAVDDVDTTSAPAADEWFWACGRYTDNTEEIDIWYNTETANLALAGWGGTLRSNATDFLIGGRHGGATLMTGRFSLAFCCTAALSNAIIGQLFQQTRAMFNV